MYTGLLQFRYFTPAVGPMLVKLAPKLNDVFATRFFCIVVQHDHVQLLPPDVRLRPGTGSDPFYRDCSKVLTFSQHSDLSDHCGKTCVCSCQHICSHMLHYVHSRQRTLGLDLDVSEETSSRCECLWISSWLLSAPSLSHVVD